MNVPDQLSRMFRAPKLTRTRIVLAVAVAAGADALQFFLGPLGWAFADQAIDLVAFLLTAWAIGFHLLLLPTFAVEFIPVVDMLPTWTACVIAVIALRKREQNQSMPPSPPMEKPGPAPRMTTLLIATRNAHKVGEIRAILGGQFQFLTLNDFPGAPKVVEDAETFAGNATKKAVELARWLNIQHSTFNIQRSKPDFVLADDSGLEVDALNGAPGVHSARFAALDKGENSHDADNNAKLLRLLKAVPAGKRTARFRCVIALAEINPQSAIRNPQLFDGACEGRIQFSASGQGGFGYDPLFVPDGFTQSFAELGEDVKNKLSHRAKALEKLKVFLTTK